MRLRWVPFLLALGLLLLAGPVTAACSWTQSKSVNMGTDNSILRLHAEAQTETSGPFLSTEAAAGAANRFKGLAETAGATNAAATVQRQEVRGVDFVLTAGLPFDAWLNLSKPIVGTLHWSSTTATTGKDAAHFRVELLVGSMRAGGIQFSCGASENVVPAHFRFRAEVDKIGAGQPVTLRITRLAGTSDVFVGTGGTQQTFVEIHYFETDPLSGALYLEDRQLHRVDAPPTTEGDAGPEAALPLASLLLFAPLAFLARSAPRRAAPAILVALAFSLGSAGCLGASTKTTAPAASDQPASTADVSYETDETLRRTGAGAIRGVVRDAEKLGVPVSGASVFLAGTSHFQRTNPEGEFRFDNLTARDYLVRIDLEGFLPLERLVTVRPGEITHVNVTLSRPASPSQWRAAHLHDDYLDAEQLTLWEDDLLPNSPPIGHIAGQYWTQPPTSDIETEIPLNEKRRIPPGTKRVEIVLTWGDAPSAPREFGIRVSTGANISIDQFFVPRKSGEPFRIAIFPNEADPGHQQHTSWKFSLSPLRIQGLPFQPTYAATKVHYKIVAFKGVVPYEPPHPKFWDGRNEILLLHEANLPTGCYGCDYPHNMFRWYLPKGVWVPPGTKEVKGYLRWTTNGFAEPVTWGLAYKPANAPSDAAYAKPVTMGPAGSGANNRTLSFVPDPTEVDQYYQAQTRWEFFPDDQFDADNVNPSLVTSPHTQLFLSVTAVRDPAFEEI